MRGAIALATLVATGLVACGSDENGGQTAGEPTPVNVPTALSSLCAIALDGGELAIDGPLVDATVRESECLLYRFEAQAGSYAAQVVTSADGDVSVIASSAPDFGAPVGASFAGSESLFEIVAPSPGTYYVALVGAAPVSTVSTRIVSVRSLPGEHDCVGIDHGSVGLDATFEDLAVAGECAVHSFETSTDTAYRVTFEVLDGADPWDISIYDGDEYVSPAHRETTDDAHPTTVAYFVARTAGTFAIVLDDFETVTRYRLGIERGTAPPGLVDECFDAVVRGTLPLDWQALSATAPPYTCDVYTFEATRDLQYAATLGSSASPQRIRTARDAEFRDLVVTTSEDAVGILAETFIADTTGTYQLAVLDGYSPYARDYELHALETAQPPTGMWCTRVKDGGRLVVDAPDVAGTGAEGECVLYTFDVVSGAAYTVAGLPNDQSRQMSLYAAEDFDQTLRVAYSDAGTVGDNGFTFVASFTGTVYLAAIYPGDYRLKVLTPPSAPAALTAQNRCRYAIDMGALAVGSPGPSGYAPEDFCLLYSFSGIAGATYTLTVTPVGGNSAQAVWASDPSYDFSTILDQLSNTHVFRPAADETLYIAIEGFTWVAATIDVSGG